MSGDKYHIEVDINNKNDPRVLMLGFIEPNKRVLDVGCASGEFGCILKHFAQTKYIVGIDIDVDALNLARSKEVYDVLIHKNLDDVGLISELSDIQFDYIIFADVLEHLREPTATLECFKKYLANDGKFLLTIPNISHASIKSNLLVDDFTYTNTGLLDSTHIHFFTHKSIATELANIGVLIESAKFSLVDILGWQPQNPYDQLPEEVKRFIFSDIHSFVCQYILSTSISSRDPNEILFENDSKLCPSDDCFPELFLNYQHDLLKTIDTKIHDARRDIVNDIFIKKFSTYCESQERYFENLNIKINVFESYQKKMVGSYVGILQKMDEYCGAQERYFEDLNIKINAYESYQNKLAGSYVDISQKIDEYCESQKRYFENLNTKINAYESYQKQMVVSYVDILKKIDEYSKNHGCKIDEHSKNIASKIDELCSAIVCLTLDKKRLLKYGKRLNAIVILLFFNICLSLFLAYILGYIILL